MKVSRVAEKMYLPYIRERLRPSTVEGYESAYEQHVKPKWGKRDIDEITWSEMQEWVSSFDLPGAAARGYKFMRQTIRWYQKHTRKFFEDPTMGIDLPRKARYVPKVLTAKQVKKFKKGIKGLDIEPVAIAQVGMGLRRCEAFGLKWEDIDLETGEVKVLRSRQYVNGKIVDTGTKTAKSTRTCWLLKRDLKRMRKIREKRPDDIYLYEGNPNTAARKLKEFCLSHDIPWVPMKNLRHTWATLAIESGAGIETVAGMLGHTDITMAYSRYIQMSKSMCQGVQKKLNKMMESV